jgi:hypothetical protein
MHGGRNRGAPAGNLNGLKHGEWLPEALEAKRAAKRAAAAVRIQVAEAVAAAEPPKRRGRPPKRKPDGTT